MTNNGSSKIDDKLLELISKDSRKVNPVGLYATIGAIVFIIGLCIVSLRLFELESRKMELTAQNAVTEAISRQLERRLLNFAYHLETASSRFVVNGSCSSFSDLFDIYPEFSEVVLLDATNSVRYACRSGSPLKRPARIANDVVKLPEILDAIKRSSTDHTPAFSLPYHSENYPEIFTELVLPPYAQGTISATVALSTAINIMTDEIFARPFQIELLVEGKPFPSGQRPPLSENSVTSTARLTPLSGQVAISTTNPDLNTLFGIDRLANSIIFFGLLLIISLATLLYYQFKQMRGDSQLRARIAVQQTFNDSITDGILVVDLEGKILYSNPAFDALFGFSSGEVIGRRARESAGFPPEITSTDNLQSGQRLELEYNAKRTDGSAFDCHLTITPLKAIAGSVRSMGWLYSMRDVTEQNRARTALATEFERTTLMLESINAEVSVIGIDSPTGELLYANALYSKQYGSSVAGHNRMRELFTAARPVNNSAEFHDKKTGRWLSVTRSELPWPGRGMAEMLAVTDITDRKKIESALEQQVKATESASQLITMGEMASSLAHELNQPLSAVQNYASASLTMLKSGRITQEGIATGLEKIINQTKRAAQIIRRIRGFVRRKGEPSSALMIPTPVGRIVEETMELARIQAKKLGMKISVEVDDSTRLISCDSVMIEQVLMNLLKNAMEASLTAESDTVELKIVNEGEFTRFTVTDHGCGIEGDLQKVFDPFYTTKSNGMGIGLNICRSVIENHKGRLLVAANPKGGTIMSVLLPNLTVGNPTVEEREKMDS